MAIEGARVRVRNLEAIDGTPIVDVKPVLAATPGHVSAADPRAGASAVLAGKPLVS